MHGEPVTLMLMSISFRTLCPGLQQLVPVCPAATRNLNLHALSTLYVSFSWDCDTKKLTGCIFITITREKTTKLIEYVIAQGSEVGLASLHCWSMGQSLGLFIGRWEKPGSKDDTCKSHNGSSKSKCCSKVKYLFEICGAATNKQLGVHSVNNKIKSKAQVWWKRLPLGLNWLTISGLTVQ